MTARSSSSISSLVRSMNLYFIISSPFVLAHQEINERFYRLEEQHALALRLEALDMWRSRLDAPELGAASGSAIGGVLLVGHAFFYRLLSRSEIPRNFWAVLLSQVVRSLYALVGHARARHDRAAAHATASTGRGGISRR